MDAIKELRRRRGWSQKDLAAESGVGQDTISGLESGRHEPRPSTLRKIAGAFGVEVADLFEAGTAPKSQRRSLNPPDSAHFDLERIIAMNMTEFAQYAETLDDGALQELRGQIDAEAAQRHSTDIKELQRLALLSFVAGLDLQVRRSEATREQLAAIVAAV